MKNKERLRIKNLKNLNKNNDLQEIICSKDIEPKRSRNLPQNPYNQKIYPGILFNNKSRPIKVIQPLDLNELKLIVILKCNIELRSIWIIIFKSYSCFFFTFIQFFLYKISIFL